MQNISKTLAAFAAALILLVSVHGIFVHDHHGTDHHVCQLCELGGGLIPTEEIQFSFSKLEFIARPVFISYESKLVLCQTSTNPLRGPPSI